MTSLPLCVHTRFHAGYVNSSDFLEVLGKYNALIFTEGSQYATHPKTTAEIKALCSDLKLLGKSDFRVLIKWRKDLLKTAAKEAAAIEAANPSLAEDADEDGSNSDDEDDEDAEQTALDDAAAEAAERKYREKKRERRKRDRARVKASASVYAESTGLHQLACRPTVHPHRCILPTERKPLLISLLTFALLMTLCVTF